MFSIEIEPTVVLRSAMAEPGDTPESAVARLEYIRT